jgi:hypothetical protein
MPDEMTSLDGEIRDERARICSRSPEYLLTTCTEATHFRSNQPTR